MLTLQSVSVWFSTF